MINSLQNKPNTAKTKNRLQKSKTSLSEDSSYLWCDFFVLSKIVFLQGFLVLMAKSMSLFSHFLFSKNLNYPSKISISTNLKTFKSNQHWHWHWHIVVQIFSSAIIYQTSSKIVQEPESEQCSHMLLLPIRIGHKLRITDQYQHKLKKKHGGE